jgi:branched-chain amino acid transport system permease protein
VSRRVSETLRLDVLRTQWNRLPRQVRGPAFPAIVIALAILYPYYNESLPNIPLFGTFPSVDTAVTMTIFIMMAIGLNIVVGYAGLLDLGYVAFYAMGAYTAAWFASPHFSESVGVKHFGSVGVNPEAAGFHISIWITVLMAAIFTAVIGVIIGLPTLRLRGDYLAIVTLGFGEIMPQIARNGDNLFSTGFNLTNGAQGINPIDPPGFGDTLNDWLGLPSDYLTAENNIRLFYWTALVFLLFTVFCSVRLRDSRLGRAWIAIREDETAAAAMGVPLMRTKTWAYAAGAFFGGIAGAYYASFKGAVFPDDFFFNISVFILCMVILGGMGNIWGVIVGGGFLAYLNQEGLGNIGAEINDTFGTNIDVPLYQFGIFGVILVLVMLFKPEGLIPSARRKAEFEEGVSDEPLYDVQR